ncbi:hypothetical protein Q8A67_019709 [Cirrhinus molitorella]|uniref:Uncharacterized protein n=1 Tax=Cirrhinus molitorella TaxID=172907 RepID=A0AA88PB83_9TELE|nr:hypothetical protein Q8A67_019709 [Cirrhinus molitorella]
MKGDRSFSERSVAWRWRPREIVGNCRGGKRCQILKRQREEPDSGWVLEVWTRAEGSGAPGIEGRIIGDRLRRDEGREQSDPAGEREKKPERERKEKRRESEDTRNICASVTTLCASGDVSTKPGSGQVTDQMLSVPLLN